MDQRERTPTNYYEALRVAFYSMLAEVWTAMPGRIISFNPREQSCKVQLMIKAIQKGTGPNGLTPQGSGSPNSPPDNSVSWTDTTPLVDVPVVFPGGGGFWLTFTPAPGDECLVIFASRCIDNWWTKGPNSQGGGQIMAEFRMMDYNDGFALVGPKSLPNAIQNLSPNAQLRSTDGSTYIELTPDGRVNIVAPQGIYLNNIRWDTHIHSGVQPGGGTTGAPVP